MNFVDRYLKKQTKLGKLCVGIDPHEEILLKWDLPINTEGLKKFVDICLEAFVGKVPVIKPQIAFFERFGSGGYEVLEYLFTQARLNDLLIIADAKRGDISSTMEAYAKAWLQIDFPLAADAVTINPFLGLSTLEPAIKVANDNQKGLFVLAVTSNPGAEIFQQAHLADSATVSKKIINKLIKINHELVPGEALGLGGIVFGATKDSEDLLDNFNGLVLTPGLGAQGATAEDLKRRFSSVYRQVIPISARGVLQFGPQIKELQNRINMLVEELDN